jgi:hypothetical protein
MIVMVATKVAHEPSAPRIPSFLLQNPRNSNAPKSRSATPRAEGEEDDHHGRPNEVVIKVASNNVEPG